MKRGPLRFLILAVGLWICARAAILAPAWWPGRDAPAPSATSGPSQPAATAAPAPAPDPAPATAPAQAPPPTPAPGSAPAPAPAPAPVSLPFAAAMVRDPAAPPFLIRELSYKTEIGFLRAAAPPLVVSAMDWGPGPALAAAEPIVPMSWRGWDGRPVATLASGPPRRWSASGWLLVRRDPGGPALAPGGTLGGSQAGARISYRLGGGFALSARASLPLRRTAGAEAAAGLDWRPVASVPLNILAERRQGLGGSGRAAFALTLYGGASRALPRRLRLDAYGQAGIVGARARDLFADGAVRLSAPVGPLEVGVGARGAAQPGAARLDAGPGLAYLLPVRGANVRIEADWRFRVAGGAAPGSGPALTLATDF